ncbi:hypothetical protein [Modestobacter versicolor]
MPRTSNGTRTSGQRWTRTSTATSSIADTTMKVTSTGSTTRW